MVLALVLVLPVLVTCHPPLNEQVVALSARLQSSPNSIELLTQRGTVYYQSQEYDRALADFESALALSPGDPVLIRHKASTLHDAGFSHSSLVLLDHHLSRNNIDADALLLRARIRVSLARLTGAISDFESVLELVESPRPEVILELANVYIQTGDLNRHERTLTFGITRIGPLAQFLEPLARTQIALGDFASAQVTIARLIEASPGSCVPALLAAERLECMGKNVEALEAFSAVIRSIDESPPRVRTNDISRSSRDYAAQAILRLSSIKEISP